MRFAPLLLLWLAVASQVTPAAPGPRSLRITSDAVLPPELNYGRDVRWASERSVYLALAMHGAREVRLDMPGQLIRKLVLGRFEPGGFSIVSHQVAASSRYFVAAAFGIALTWRRLDNPTRYDEAVEVIQAVDLWNDRLLLVGARRDDQRRYAADGAVAWIGSLDKKLSDLKPVLYAASGPGAREMNACSQVPLGAARFFEDGSFFILPGVQPGLGFYSREGKLLRTVDTTALGIDSDCGAMSEEQVRRIAVDLSPRRAWINQRRIVDTAFVLPQGVGLVVRSVENGRVRWRLDILKAAGKIESHPVPIEAPDEFYHLQGDSRGDRLVFVLFQRPPREIIHVPPAQPRLITASMES